MCYHSSWLCIFDDLKNYVRHLSSLSVWSHIVLVTNLPKGEIVDVLHVGCTFAKTKMLDAMFQHLGAIPVHHVTCASSFAPLIFQGIHVCLLTGEGMYCYLCSKARASDKD